MGNNQVKSYKYEAIKRLWKFLENSYGEDYFTEVIEDKFGISD
mgnify:CR=1 FL=1